MKIAELRQAIEKHSDNELRELVVLLYKAIPAAKKRGDCVDELVKNPMERKQAKAVSQSVDIEQLRDETEEFISNASAGYYVMPNRVVRKEDRPKWRFVVKRLFKALSRITADDDLPTAIDLLERLYSVLCGACYETLFNSYDVFESVGVDQTEFLRRILALKIKTENPKDFIRNSILLVINEPLSRYALHSYLLQVIVEFLKTADMKTIAIEQCDAIRSEAQEKYSSTINKNKDSEWRRRQAHNKTLENLALMGFYCYVALFEYDEAVTYFKRSRSDKEPEIALYVLLRFLAECKLPDLWIREYEEAVRSGVEPRKELVKTYDFISTHQRLPSTAEEYRVIYG